MRRVKTERRKERETDIEKRELEGEREREERKWTMPEKRGKN